MGYGELIKQIRISKGMSLRQFGEYVGISHMHISRLEKEYSDKGKEKLKVPINELRQICDKTHYPFRKFLEEAEYIEPVEEEYFTTIFKGLSDEAQEIIITALGAAVEYDEGKIPAQAEIFKQLILKINQSRRR